jgi:hypothetical protein
MSGRSRSAASSSLATRTELFGRLNPCTFSMPDARPAATLPLPGDASCCATRAAASAAPSVRFAIGVSSPVPTLRVAIRVSPDMQCRAVIARLVLLGD